MTRETWVEIWNDGALKPVSCRGPMTTDEAARNATIQADYIKRMGWGHRVEITKRKAVTR
jgi:hypothetical protein